jgi:hypothetical protein
MVLSRRSNDQDSPVPHKRAFLNPLDTISLAACRTYNELATNSSLWPIFQLLFDQQLRLLLSNELKSGLKQPSFRFSPDCPTGC